MKSRRTPELLKQLVKDTAAVPLNLLVAATERGRMDAERVRQIIHEIRALGIEVAVDDFGAAYSSLSYLGTFELDYLDRQVGAEAALGRVCCARPLA